MVVDVRGHAFLNADGAHLIYLQLLSTPWHRLALYGAVV